MEAEEGRRVVEFLKQGRLWLDGYKEGLYRPSLVLPELDM